jgi:hypothetical protein
MLYVVNCLVLVGCRGCAGEACHSRRVRYQWSATIMGSSPAPEGSGSIALPRTAPNARSGSAAFIA